MKSLFLLMVVAYSYMAWAGATATGAKPASSPAALVAASRVPASNNMQVEDAVKVADGNLFRVHDTTVRATCFVLVVSGGSQLQCFPDAQVTR